LRPGAKAHSLSRPSPPQASCLLPPRRLKQLGGEPSAVDATEELPGPPLLPQDATETPRERHTLPPSSSSLSSSPIVVLAPARGPPQSAAVSPRGQRRPPAGKSCPVEAPLSSPSKPSTNRAAQALESSSPSPDRRRCRRTPATNSTSPEPLRPRRRHESHQGEPAVISPLPKLLPELPSPSSSPPVSGRRHCCRSYGLEPSRESPVVAEDARRRGLPPSAPPLLLPWPFGHSGDHSAMPEVTGG